MRLDVASTTLALVRLPKDAAPPDWASLEAPFTSVTRTEVELSIVCAQDRVPSGVDREQGWRALVVHGALDLSLTGVLVSLATPLAQAGIAIFAISTYETDYVLVREEQLEQAIAALAGEGHEVAAT